MEFEPDQEDEPSKFDGKGCLTIVAKVIAGGIVLVIVAIALVFGLCWFGSGNG